jgi:hypothetical protein
MEQHNDWAAPGRRYMTLENAAIIRDPFGASYASTRALDSSGTTGSTR